MRTALQVVQVAAAAMPSFAVTRNTTPVTLPEMLVADAHVNVKGPPGALAPAMIASLRDLSDQAAPLTQHPRHLQR